jgi:mitochondrial fission protein ELM1
MPQNFEKWFPKFSGNDAIIVEEHLDNFWACFQTHPLNDEDEDIVIVVESTNQMTNRRFANLPKAYRRNPPHNSPIVKSLFGGRLPLSPMAQNPWAVNVFNPLDICSRP